MKSAAAVATVLSAVIVLAATSSQVAHAAPNHHKKISIINQLKTAKSMAQNQPAQTKQSASPDTKKSAQPKPPKKHHKVVVKVESGDNLSKIASRNHSTALRIFYANKQIDNPNLIYPGQKLRIPAASEKLTVRPVPQADPAPQPQPTASPAQPSRPAPSQPTPAPAPSQPVAQTAADGSAWDRLAACESGGNWQTNTGNGFYGGLQFTLSSWHAVGGQGLPSSASRSEQISRAQQLQARQGWNAWPVCSVKAGLR